MGDIPAAGLAYLKDAIERPEAAEPDHGVAKPKADVDDGCAHEASTQEEGGRGAGSQHAAHEFAEPVGDGEDGGHGSHLGDVHLQSWVCHHHWCSVGQTVARQVEACIPASNVLGG